MEALSPMPQGLGVVLADLLDAVDPEPRRLRRAGK
jgi:hypothetical protein